MNIAIFHDLPSGGALRALYEETRILCQRHHCDIYTLSTADHEFCNLRQLADRYIIINFTPRKLFLRPFGRLNQGQRWLDLWELDSIAQQFAGEIDGCGYDVVFAHPCQWTQAPLLIRHLKTPVVYYLQEPPRHLYTEGWYKPDLGWRFLLNKIDPLLAMYQNTAKRLDYDATRMSNRVLVNSEFMRTVVNKTYEIDPSVCYLGVDTNVFHPISSINRQSHVLSVGAVSPMKGFDFLIQSLGRIEPAHRPAFHIVGNVSNSNESHRLFNLAAAHGVKLWIDVNLNLDQLVKLYNQTSLFIYAPYNEPFGLTPLEAMACGIPVVGVAEGGIRETIVDGVTGRLVDRNPEQMGQVIEWFLRNPEERMKYGQRASENVKQNWAWEKAVQRIEEQLLSVNE